MKADPTNMSTYTLKSQIMGLELILNVVEKPGATFLTRPEFINIIKTSLCNGLLKHCVSNEKTVFALSISIFYALFVHFREHLKFEILVLIEQIFLKVLNSGNSNYHHKYLILRVFDKIAKNTKHLIEIFVNYD
jgi:brefeldin A-inhibited guanine nucleotide-exchange protein